MKEKKYTLLDVKAVVLQLIFLHYLDYLFEKAFSGMTSQNETHAGSACSLFKMIYEYACQPQLKLI